MSSIKHKIIINGLMHSFFDFSEEVFHYGKVFVSLKKTIRLMGEVDGVIESAGGCPLK